MFIIYNTVERLKLNVPGVFGLFDKIGITFPIDWQNEDRSREIKYCKIYCIPLSPSLNRANSINIPQNSITTCASYTGSNIPFSSSSSSPIQDKISDSSSGNIPLQPNFNINSTDQSLSLPNSPSLNDRQKKSKGLGFFQKRSQTGSPSNISYMLENDENFRKLVLSTPGLPHSLRRRFWFSASGGFKLSLQFSDAWEQACHAATAAEAETNIPLADVEFDAFLGGRIDTLTFLPPAIQLQISTFLHVFAHAQCGTVEFSPMVSTAASLLLLYLEPSLAYLALTAMVNRSKTENNFYFILSRPALLAESSVFRLLCEKLVKNVVRHAESIGVNMEAIHLVCAPMFFFPFIPLQSALTLFDCFVVEGRKFILQFSLALLQSEERNLLQATDVDSFVGVIVNALERLAEVNVMKSFIIKNVERIDIGKWRRIIALEQSYMDPKNKKMMPFEIREDDRALVSFEQRIEAEHPSDDNVNYEEEYNNEMNYYNDDDNDNDIDINLNLVDIKNSDQNDLKMNINDIVNDSNNNNMNTCGSYSNQANKTENINLDSFDRKPSNPSFDKETDSLLSSSFDNDPTFRPKNKKALIKTSGSTQFHFSPSSFEPSIKRTLLASNDEIDAAQKMMAPSIKQNLPKIHGGRLLDVHLFYSIRSRLPPVYHRFSCQLVFAKSLNGASLENLISATMLSYSPSYSSSASILSSNSSIMFSSSNLNSNSNLNLNGKNGLNLFNDNLSSSEVNNNDNNGVGYYQCTLPHIIVIETLSGKRFGALLSDPLKYDSGNSFYGRPNTLVFDASLPQIYQKHPCPNSMFVLSSPDGLAIGGPQPAIKLNADLSAVESDECFTFGSPSLITGDENNATDIVKEVEVYRLKDYAKRSANHRYSAKMV